MVQAENAILVYENQTKITSLSDIFTFFLCHASSVKTVNTWLKIPLSPAAPQTPTIPRSPDLSA